MADLRPSLHGHRVRAVGRALAAVALALAGYAAAQGWSAIDGAELAALTSGAATVQDANRAVERTGLEAVAAATLVRGSVRTGVAVGDDGDGVDLSPAALTIATDWYLFPSGPAHDAAVRAAEAHRDALAAATDAALDALVDAVRRLADLERHDAAVAIAAARVDLADRTLAATSLRRDAGAASDAAVTEAGLDATQARFDLATAELDRAEARAAFARALGREPSTLLVPAADPLAALAAEVATRAAPSPLVVGEAARAAAVAASDGVGRAQDALTAAQDAAVDARTAAGPSAALAASAAVQGDAGRASLAASWGTATRQPGIDLTVDPWASAPAAGASWSLGVTVTLPFGGATTTAVDLADLGVREAAVRLDAARLDAETALDAAVRADADAAARVDLARTRVDLRATTLASFTVRAQAGDATALEVERARLDLADAHLALARALDAAWWARTHLELVLDRTPTLAPLPAAHAALTSEAPR